MPDSTLTEHLILGIDPGTNIMGYALLKTRLRNSEIVTLDVLKMNRLSDQCSKLKAIYDGVTQLIEQYHPDILSIEEPFYGKNPQSMLKLGRAQGVAIGACLHAGMEVFEYTPRRIKQSITGKGSASKEQVAAMLHHMYDFSSESPYLDATDALAAAVCHHLQCRLDFGKGKANSWAAFLSQNQDRIIR
ncbi:MAG: crossover junction endodeoxyribonuclease RuvC [Bacteroidales bacterium]|nr:crossover junction endodeoxyribonuclease RuvC [Bacteroidales bacterium]